MSLGLGRPIKKHYQIPKPKAYFAVTMASSISSFLSKKKKKFTLRKFFLLPNLNVVPMFLIHFISWLLWVFLLLQGPWYSICMAPFDPGNNAMR